VSPRPRAAGPPLAELFSDLLAPTEGFPAAVAPPDPVALEVRLRRLAQAYQLARDRLGFEHPEAQAAGRAFEAGMVEYVRTVRELEAARPLAPDDRLHRERRR
jgi:hypothetical protein